MAESENEFLINALQYAEKQWRVFPLKTRAKTPRIKKWQKDATTDEQQIRTWWERWPDANVAIACGPESNFLVLDIDGADGETSVGERELPETVSATTGKGRHLYYQYPASLSTVSTSKTNILHKVDVRGKGGYVVAPPSIHPEGGTYKWKEGLTPDDIQVAEAPKWLVDLLANGQKTKVNEAVLSSNERATVDDDEFVKLQATVNAIDPDIDQESWIKFGWGLHATGRGEEALRVWHDWSSKGKKYQPGECETRWASFKANGGITYRTIYDIAKKSGVGGVGGVKPENMRATADTSSGNAGGVGGVEIPRGFTVNSHGVFFQADGKDASSQWICSPLHVEAMVRSKEQEGWGRLLTFLDDDGEKHTWSCPMELFAGDGTEFRRTLFDEGLSIAPGLTARHKLTQYVQTVRTQNRARCVDKTGWYENVFVLPDETIGTSNERIVYQSFAVPPKMHQSGTLEQWQESVSRYCRGNSRLLVAVSAAFAAPLLELTNEPSGGIHFKGASSNGKTTALYVGASVWEDTDSLPSWKSTLNGLEGTAFAHNDRLLTLDELGMVSPWECGSAAYMLANGAGKQRANRKGQSKPVATWRLLFLSSGEIDLAQHMLDAGKKSMAGQEVRLATIPADALAGYGLFECLHGYDDGGLFSDDLRDATKSYHGVAGRAFLEILTTKKRSSVSKTIKTYKKAFLNMQSVDGADGQTRRVAARFALIAAAGEIATIWGITGWAKGEASRAAAKCFQAWLEYRGGPGAQEDRKALNQALNFIDAHGASRFENSAYPPDHRVINRAGYWQQKGSYDEFYIFSGTFKEEVCKGFDSRRVAQLLRGKGLLITDDATHLTTSRRGKRFYGVRVPSRDFSDTASTPVTPVTPVENSLPVSPGTLAMTGKTPVTPVHNTKEAH